ncbi:BZ3500_MvSof-1268-A1-R1_Chr2-2g05021 [Microbotryum saponariae]|uniref:BZ3500_MvSof-1268-A1-R1_Chr2-2g05021 protein n=1 Tax=Microbotryum saponariae TaxID=289078 RepID=A0A2X0M977_9BASI|nr:BZ3500_MvSof-1268-A1-R1_Chr2-2g05021 [Microbotryum saponariae]SDA00720.1 BZ3501_MvSof-1269-A2-R1_Chr2-2g04695 [Microbotryum saponariae]
MRWFPRHSCAPATQIPNTPLVPDWFWSLPIVAHGVRFAATLASLSASQRLRQALVDPKSTITHLERLANKVEDVRNINPSTRQTSLALAARAGRLDVCDWLLFDEGHEEIEISRVSSQVVPSWVCLFTLWSHRTTLTLCPSTDEVVSATQDAAGETILHIAAASGFVDLLNLYLSQYPFVLDWVDARGATPLHIAAMKDQLEAVQVSTGPARAALPSIHESSFGNWRCSQILIHAGSEIDVRDMFGNTALHYAASWGSLPVIKLLIELDCDYNATNGEGFIPYEYAYSFDVARAMKEFYEDRIVERSRKAERRRARRARIATTSPSLSGESVAHSDNYAYESSSSMERDPSPIGICLGSPSRSGTGDTLRPAPRQNQSGSSSRRTSQREGPNGSSKRNSATSDLATAFNQVSEVSDSNASRSETPSRLNLFGRKEGGSGDGRGLPRSPISPPPVTSLSPTDLSLDGRRSDEGISSASVAPRHRSQSSVFPSQSTLVAKQDGPPIPTRSRTLDPLVPGHTLFTARSDERDPSSSNRMRLGKLTKDPSSGTATSTAMGTELDQTSPVPGVLRSRTTGSVVSSASHGGRASRMAKALGLGLGRK